MKYLTLFICLFCLCLNCYADESEINKCILKDNYKVYSYDITDDCLFEIVFIQYETGKVIKKQYDIYNGILDLNNVEYGKYIYKPEIQYYKKETRED